jgi:hypothetical protein
MGKGVERPRHTLKERYSFRFFPNLGNVQNGILARYLKSS